MLAYYGSCGITSVVPSTMSYGEDVLNAIIRAANPYFGKYGYGAVLRGINMEGPFINTAKKGAQNPDNIMAPDPELFDRLYELSQGRIRLLDMAPELPGSDRLIKSSCAKCTVSLAHTCADYDTAKSAFEAGATHVTHLFNAMPPLSHRDPGVVGAAFDYAEHVEIISDGVHLHPAVVRAMFRLFGASRICLISDSVRSTGMPNGRYDLGGQETILKDGRSNLVSDGAIAGSAMNLADCCRSAVKFGIPLKDAVLAASLNPAQATGISDIVGSLEPGKNADILIWNQDLSQEAVFVGGKKLC
jgi:N-acetylglucosamine-6-phosphate deacetylase